MYTTHAIPPIAHGSFLPLTDLPGTNFSGLVLGGKYRLCIWGGSEVRVEEEACVDVIEHQGASVFR